MWSCTVCGHVQDKVMYSVWSCIVCGHVQYVVMSVPCHSQPLCPVILASSTTAEEPVREDITG